MLKKWIREYIEINKREIMLIITMLVIGVCVGVLLYAFSDASVKEQALSSAKKVFDISKSETYVKTNIISNGIKSDVVLIFAIATFSVTLFGKWAIYLIMMLKGAALSLYSILLFNLFGPLWGMLVFFLLVVLVNILYIPSLIYLTVNFLNINFSIFKVRLNTQSALGLSKIIISVILCFIVMFSSVVVEQIVSSIALNIYSKI